MLSRQEMEKFQTIFCKLNKMLLLISVFLFMERDEAPGQGFHTNVNY